MDWDFAIKRNREALARIIAALALIAGLAAGRKSYWPNGAFALPRPAYLAALRLLRPAESALRRLIMLVMHQLPARQTTHLDRPRPLPDFSVFTRLAPTARRPSFRLIDPRKRFLPFDDEAFVPRANGASPRICVPGLSGDRSETAPDGCGTPSHGPQHTVPCARLVRRIHALCHGLDTLPRQARRLVRLLNRRAKAPPGPSRVGPLRPGWPPGHRRKKRNPIDQILEICHGLARQSEHLFDRPPTI